MNYEKIYDNLILSRNSINRSKNDNLYFEKHHIIPRSWGGSDDEDNMILLTAKEHWIAHLLLLKIATGQNKYKANQAVVNMGRVISYNKRKVSKLYESARKHIANEISKRHTGTLIVKDFVSGNRIGRVSKNHPKVISGEWVFFHVGMKRDKKQYANFLDTKGDKNPKYCGLTDEDIVNYGIELFNKIGDISPLNDLRIYVKKFHNKDIPKSFSKCRFPNKSYYEIIEEKTNTKYNGRKRGKLMKEYKTKFKELIND